MKCENAIEFLSLYHDGELSADVRAALEVHLEGCVACSTELMALRRLSELAAQLDVPKPRREHDNQNDSRSRLSADNPTENQPKRLRTAAILSALAATVLIAFAFQNWSHNDHQHADLAKYWNRFQTNPADAQNELVNRYTGRLVSADEAVKEVGFRPSVERLDPATVRVKNSYVLKMPCCRCLQTICRRPDGSELIVLEHREEQPNWFPTLSHVNIRCSDTTCRITEIDGLLAASWPLGDRRLTVIGLDDLNELASWVESLANDFL